MLPPILLDYSKQRTSPLTTRSAEAAGDSYDCSCYISDIARSNLAYPIYHMLRSRNVGAPTPEPSLNTPSNIKVCSVCHAEVGPGKSHPCTLRAKGENLERIVKESSEKSKPIY